MGCNLIDFDLSVRFNPTMKLFKCPCCNKLHFTRLNGIQFENTFKTLQDYTLKKKIECQKCFNTILVFVHNKDGKSKIIWEEYYKYEDESHQKLEKLQAYKDEILNDPENDDMKRHRLENVMKEIRHIQNWKSKHQASLRIKARIISPKASMGINDRLSN